MQGLCGLCCPGGQERGQQQPLPAVNVLPTCSSEISGPLSSAQPVLGRRFMSPLVQLCLEVEETFSTRCDKSKERGRNDSEGTRVFNRAPMSTAERLQMI